MSKDKIWTAEWVEDRVRVGAGAQVFMGPLGKWRSIEGLESFKQVIEIFRMRLPDWQLSD